MWIGAIDFHTLPIKYRRHASDRLKERFRMATDEVRHCLKTGKHIKKPRKDGDIGIVERVIGGFTIRFVYTIRSRVIYIITVEDSS